MNSTEKKILAELENIQPHTKACKKCGTSFPIEEQDIELLKKVIAPLPSLCPTCRAQRRLSFRNERKYYKRTCDATGKDMISVYSPLSKHKVYHQDYWWSDNWNPMDFGQTYKSSKPFFQQFQELYLQVPQQALVGGNNENCGFCHLLANCRDCYLVVESSNADKSLYGYWLQKCIDCVDTSFSHECERSYEIDNCYNCYNLRYSKDCSNCSDSSYLIDCIGCKNCFACTNLVQKEYCIFNEQYTKEEYEKRIKTINKKSIEEFVLKQPRRAVHIKKSENCSGDYILESKNCNICYHAHDAENCRYGEHVFRKAKDCMDVSTCGREAELVYEAINSGIGLYKATVSIQSWSNKYIEYCIDCHNSEHLFGCIGLRNAKYCIFNKQYTKEHYEELVDNIKADMLARGEYGEFFPSYMSPFGYNETVAQEQYPLTPTAATSQGFHWSDYDPDTGYTGPFYTPLVDVQEYQDEAKARELLNGVLQCEVTKKPFKVISQELAFYIKNDIPIPKKSPNQRHLERMAKRTPPFKIWKRACDKCQKDLLTGYAPDRKETIYCEDCYRKEYY